MFSFEFKMPIDYSSFMNSKIPYRIEYTKRLERPRKIQSSWKKNDVMLVNATAAEVFVNRFYGSTQNILILFKNFLL